MTTQTKALKLALEALETSMYPQQKQLQAITAIKEALSSPNGEAQPEQRSVSEQQEPVAIVDSTISGHIDWLCTFFPKQGTKLYTAPPQRTAAESEDTRRAWVGLTEQEAAECWSTSTVRTWQSIEAKLKEKNT